MIAVLKNGTSQEQMEQLISWLKGQGTDVHISQGEKATVLGLVGNTDNIDGELLGSFPIVESVKRITQPYRRCDRRTQDENTVVSVGKVKIGGGHFAIIAGPCSIETPEQILAVAQSVKASGASS